MEEKISGFHGRLMPSCLVAKHLARSGSDITIAASGSSVRSLINGTRRGVCWGGRLKQVDATQPNR